LNLVFGRRGSPAHKTRGGGGKELRGGVYRRKGHRGKNCQKVNRDGPTS